MDYEFSVSMTNNTTANVRLVEDNSGPSVEIGGRTYSIQSSDPILTEKILSIASNHNIESTEDLAIGLRHLSDVSSVSTSKQVHEVAIQTLAKASSVSGPAGPATSQSAAQKQLMFWLDCFNSGERSKIQELQAQFTTPRPPEDVEGLLGLFDHVQGFNLIKVTNETPTSITVLLRESCAFQEYAELTIEIEPITPHRFVDVRLAPANDIEPPAVKRMTESHAVNEINKEIDRLTDKGQFSGTVLVTKAGSSTPVISRSVGLSNIEQQTKIDASTKFSIASCGKMFTSVVILQLVEQGSISLEDPIGMYVTGLNDDLAKVKIRQLLTHTAGTGPVPHEHASKASSVGELVKLCGSRTPEFTPGSQWKYSNFGFVLLGAAIENVTGKEYYQAVSENIFKPLGMSNTSYPTKTDVVENRAEGYIRKRDGLHNNNDLLPAIGTPAGGAYSTVGDFNTFAEGLLANRLLTSSLESLTTAQEVCPGSRYTLGFQDGDLWFGHAGREDGINAELRIYPKSGYIVSVMANLDPPAASDLAEYIGARLPEE